MGVISVASGNSCWRGLDYYKNNKVKKLIKINENEYKSIVKGNSEYEVYLNTKHVRKSKCNCPYANGKRIICKHIVATYFQAFPEEAINFEKEQERLEEEYEKEQEELYDKVIKYLYKMKKEELINEIINIFDYGPECIYKDFIRRNYID